jgi:hypothetical protein
MTRIYILLTLSVLLDGCDMASKGGVQDAKGDTAVKYVLCDSAEKNCFVDARFKDMGGCESHKAWADMLCDSRTVPGKMICSSGADIVGKYGSYCTF